MAFPPTSRVTSTDTTLMRCIYKMHYIAMPSKVLNLHRLKLLHMVGTRPFSGSEIEIKVSYYSNLSRDHLDRYHGTLEVHAEAKSRLFHLPIIESCSHQSDDEYVGVMIQAAQNNPAQPNFNYSTIAACRLSVKNIQYSPTGATLVCVRHRPNISTEPTLGHFNIENLVASLITWLNALEDLADVVATTAQPKARQVVCAIS
jgi:UDP-N-acetylmuramoyl-L-alanyl-D-glutamate--2,6-diaminopimelate ligase